MYGDGEISQVSFGSDHHQDWYNGGYDELDDLKGSSSSFMGSHLPDQLGRHTHESYHDHLDDPYSSSSFIPPSTHDHYGLSDQDWNAATEEFANLGLSDSNHHHLHPSDPIESSYSNHHDLDHHHHHYHRLSSDLDVGPISPTIHPDHLQHPSPSNLLNSPHLSSSHGNSSYSSSLYSPGRYGHDNPVLERDLYSNPSYPLELDDDLPNPNYLSSADPHRGLDEPYDFPDLDGKTQRDHHHLPSAFHPTHSTRTNPLSPSLDDIDDHDLYQQDLQHQWDHHHQHPRDVRFEERHPPTSIDSASLDRNPSHFSNSLYDLRDPSQRHHSNDYQSEASWSHHHHPSSNDLSRTPPIHPRSPLRDDLRHSNTTLSADPLLSATNPSLFDDVSAHSYTSPRALYSPHASFSHDQYTRTPPQGYTANRRNDVLSPVSPALESLRGEQGLGRSHRSDRLPQMRSEVERVLNDSLNGHHDPQRSLSHVYPHESDADPRWDEIDRMRAQLDNSLTRDASLLGPQLVPEHPISRSWDRSPFLTGRRSPHSRLSQPPLIPPLDGSGQHSILDPLPRPLTPRSVASARRSPYSGRQSPYSGRRSPHPERRSPHSNLIHDSWQPTAMAPIQPLREPLVSLRARARTPPVVGLTSGHHHPSYSSIGHGDSLRSQLNQIDALNHQIRDSERAHQRELALVNQAANELAQQSLNNDLDRAEAAHHRELTLANQQVSHLAQQSLVKDLHRNEIAHQRDLALASQLANQRASQLGQQSIIQAARENEIYRELDQQRRQLDRQRAELSRQRDRSDAQTQLRMIDRQLQAIDRQREVDRNRQLANLSRFGNLPSILRGTYAGRPLASPYLQQSRFLSAARRWSDRDKSRHRLPAVYDHVDAYYRLMSDHLPRQLPMFKDPYYSYSPHLFSTTTPRTRLSDPFVDGIDYDYGYGRVGTLGLKLERFAREQAYILDDLYLFELLLRLDETIDELERQRRWNARLRWEEWADNRSRVEAWRRMTTLERKRLGLSEGSYWASNLFGIPLDSRFGYTNSVNFSRYRPTGLHPHYSLTSGLSSRYPMWGRGGIGLGRRISNWYDYTRPYSQQKYLDRQDRIKQEYAQRRGDLSAGSILKSPGLMLTGSHRYGPPGGLGSTGLLGQHLDPLKRLRTTSLTGGLSRVPSSTSRNLTGLTGSSTLSSTSLPGLASLKQSLLSSSIPRHTTSNSTTNVPVLTTPKATIPRSVDPKSNPIGKSISSNRSASLITPKPIPIKSSSLSNSNIVKPTPIGSHESGTGKNGHRLTSSSSNTTTNSRSKTPTIEDSNNKKEIVPIKEGGVVVFNPRVKAVPPESVTDPPLEPRPPSRTSMRPSRSVLKTPPPKTTKDRSSHTHQNSVSVSHLDDDRLESITKLNTERNRSTPAPPTDIDLPDHRS